MSIKNLRWDPYLLASTSNAEELVIDHFSESGNSTVLFILGKGFDVRMNFVCEKLMRLCPALNIEFWLICYNEGADSSSHKYKHLVDHNMNEFATLTEGKLVTERNINLWKEDGFRKRRVGDREAASLIQNFSDISKFTDIYVDISALPRGVYFSLIGKLLYFVDNLQADSTKPNLVVTVAENAKLDACIKENTIDNEGKFLLGFMGGIKSPAERQESLIWLPIIGEDKAAQITTARDELQPTEVCPIFPFPAKNPHRPDALIIDYHKLLFDVIKVEAQNIMYVPEQNPFEAYKILVKTVRNYNNSLKILKGCRAALSTFSSKLLSIGTLLAAYQINTVDNKEIIGVMNVDSKGYDIENLEAFEEHKNESEFFIIWLTGKPYEE